MSYELNHKKLREFRPQVLVSTNWVQDHLDDRNLRIAEVNSNPRSNYKSGHIPGAVLFRWKEDLHDSIGKHIITKNRCQELLKKSRVNNNTLLVLYGESRNKFAISAFWLFDSCGYTNIRIMDGGREKWVKEKRPMNRTVPAYAPRKFIISRKLQVHHQKTEEAYCIKCKSKRLMKDEKKVTMKNGNPATQLICTICGTKMFKIGGFSKPTAPPLARPGVASFSRRKLKIEPSMRAIRRIPYSLSRQEEKYETERLRRRPKNNAIRRIKRQVPISNHAIMFKRLHPVPLHGAGPRYYKEKIQGEKLSERYAYASFPSHVNLDDEVLLQVVIKARIPKTNTNVDVSDSTTLIRIKPKAVVTVLVDQENFSVPDEVYSKIIVVPKEGDSESVTFKLKPKRAGNLSIIITLLHSGNLLGTLNIKTHVSATAHTIKHEATPDLSTQKTVSSDLSLLDEALPKPDVTIVIYEIERTPEYVFDILVNDKFMDFIKKDPALRIQVKESLNREKQDLEKEGKTLKYNLPKGYKKGELVPIARRYLPDTTELNVLKMLKELEENKNYPIVIRNRLRGYGEDYYRLLFPEFFRSIYWKYRHQIKSFFVLTKDPYIPWELVRPYNQDTKEDSDEDEQLSLSLCESHSFARWIYGENVVNPKKELRKIVAVIPPKSPLPFAKDEIQYFNEELKNSKGIEVVFESTYTHLRDALKGGNFDLVHFSTHGKFNRNDPLSSPINLANGGTLVSVDLGNNWSRFKTAKPMIVMSTCNSAKQKSFLSSIGGWPVKFLFMGAPVFIGTMWRVNDEVAFKFIKNLYNLLSSANGKTLGESVKSARLACKGEFESSGDYSWLAYQLYSQPNFQIKLSGKHMS
jgi:hypothetical protein